VLSITKEINNRDGGSGFDIEKSKANIRKCEGSR
jgi:hypothetical protein